MRLLLGYLNCASRIKTTTTEICLLSMKWCLRAATTAANNNNQLFVVNYHQNIASIDAGSRVGREVDNCEMFRKGFAGKRAAASGCADIHHSCSVRFLDDTEPLTVTFQVRTLLLYIRAWLKMRSGADVRSGSNISIKYGAD